MLYRPSPACDGQKVFIAVAAYQGLGAGFAWSLAHTTAALTARAIGWELAIYAGNCHVDDSRNRLTRDFLNSDCTDMVFLDADIGWQAEDFARLVQHDRDIVAGIYPKKHGDDAWPVKLIPGEIWSDASGLIEVQGAPTGFLRIRRVVMERLHEASPKYNARNDRAFATACIFERQIHDGSRWGGDYVFCRKARGAGFRVYVDPSFSLEHSGEHTWAGSLGVHLKREAGLGLSDPLAAIAGRRETLDDILALHEAWGNPFAASPLMLKALAEIVRARGGAVLELGSGLSTLVMAAANPDARVICLEHSPIFAEHLRIEANRLGLANIAIQSAPLRNGWYESVPCGDWSLVVVDGPPRKQGARSVVFDRVDMSRSAVVIDDVQRETGAPELAARLAMTHRTEVIEIDARAFIIGVPRREAA